MLSEKTRLRAVAVEGGQDSLDDAADEAEKAVDNNVDDNLQGADDQDDLGEDAETDKAGDVATDLANNVDVVGATLGAVTNTVEVALAKSELAGKAVDALEKTERQINIDIGSNNSMTDDISVEGNNGINDALEIETRQGTTDVLQVSADVGMDIDVNLGLDGGLELDIGGSAEGDGVEADLAVLVLGVVLDDLGRRLGAESSKLDVDRGVDLDIRLDPGTDELLANTGLGLEVQLLARSASASLGPGAVGHAVRALVAGMGFLGVEDLDIEIEIDLDIETDTSNLGVDIDFDVGINTNKAPGGRGNTSEGGESSNETHLDYDPVRMIHYKTSSE